MQKRKFSLQNFEGGRALSREEMKLVLGGVAAAQTQVFVCGTNENGGQYTCDFCDVSTYEPVMCEVPCPAGIAQVGVGLP